MDNSLIIKIVAGYLIVINIAEFLLFGIDKGRAVKGRWRISEAALILAAVIGGSLGGLLGMKLFRHKTQHLKFRVGIPLILLLQIMGGSLYYFR